MADLLGSETETGSRLTDRNIRRLVRLVGLSSEDSAHIAAFRDAVLADAVGLTAGFFDSLRRLGGTPSLFRNDEALTEATRLKHEHLLAMLSGEYGPDYGE